MKSTQLLQRLHVAILLCLNEVSFSLIPSTLTFTNYQRIPGSGFSHNRKEQHLFQSSWQSSNGNKNAKIRSISKTTKLNGMNEWRDTYFDIPSLQAEEEGLLSGIDENGIPREITVLPFPYEDVLLQGETKQLRLYEDRYVLSVCTNTFFSLFSCEVDWQYITLLFSCNHSSCFFWMNEWMTN